MASRRVEPILQYLRRTMLRRDETGLTDGQLLERFLSGDEAAFEALVRRHGQMVLGVCRRIVGDAHDADDCFQATFFVLVRKAASIWPRDKVGNWLYGVARTTAIRVKTAKIKRQRRERHVAQMPDVEAMSDDLRDERHALLDEELARLPEKYRTPIVLCDLEGRTRKDVARQLKIPEGTLSSRLTTARRMLADRLARRGLAVSAGSLASILMQQSASASVPAALTSSTVKAALLLVAGQTITAAAVSLSVAALTEGVLKTMLLTKLKWVMTTTLLTVLLVGGTGLIYRTQGAESPPLLGRSEGKNDKQIPAAKPKTEQERLQGTWISTKSINDAKEDEDTINEWTFKDGTVRMKTQPKEGKTTIEFWRYRLDATTTPKRIDFVIWEKDFTDKNLKYREEKSEGIYSFHDDTLTICLGWEAGKCPTTFEGKKNCGLVTFKKVAEKKDLRQERSGTVAKPKIADPLLSDEIVLGVEAEREVEFYETLFENALDVVDDFFEIAYANRYDGRIETSPHSAEKESIRRRAIVSILREDWGDYRVSVRVMKEETAPGLKTPQPKGRDTELEQTILRRIVERTRRGQTNQLRNPQGRIRIIGDTRNTLQLPNVQLDAVNRSERTISLVTLKGSMSQLMNVPVAKDADITDSSVRKATLFF